MRPAIGKQYRATTDRTNQDGTSEARSRDEVLADAVRVLTEAARLRRPLLEQAAQRRLEGTSHSH